MHVRILTLNDGMRFHKVKAPNAPIVLTIKNYVIFALLTITVDEWRITNTLTKDRMSVPSQIRLSPYVAFKLRHLIEDGNYSIQPLLVHNHEFNYLSSTGTGPTEQPAAGEE